MLKNLMKKNKIVMLVGKVRNMQRKMGELKNLQSITKTLENLIESRHAWVGAGT
jgi:hypothetical protein